MPRSVPQLLLLVFVLFQVTNVSPARQYEGSMNAMTSSCSDPEDTDFEFALSGDLVVQDDLGETFQASAILKVDDPEFDCEMAFSFEGTNTDNLLQGTFQEEFSCSNGFGSSGSGTFTGQDNLGHISIQIQGQDVDIEGVSCTLAGIFEGDRSDCPQGGETCVPGCPNSSCPSPTPTLTFTQTPTITTTPTEAQTQTPTPTCDCLPACPDTRINIECLTPGSSKYRNSRFVCLITEQGAPAGLSGTGFVIAVTQSKALVLTASHLLTQSATAYRVDFDVECDRCACGVQKQPHGAPVLGLLGRNTDLDYALLEISVNVASGRGTAKLDLRSLRQGASVYSIDHSEARMKGYGEGHVTETFVPSQGGTTRTRVSISVSRGSSGGPVFATDRHSVTGLIAGGNGGACSGDTFIVPMVEVLKDASGVIFGAGYQLSIQKLADGNLDEIIDSLDLFQFTSALGLQDVFFDIAPLPDTDGVVDKEDLLELYRQWK